MNNKGTDQPAHSVSGKFSSSTSCKLRKFNLVFISEHGLSFTIHQTFFFVPGSITDPSLHTGSGNNVQVSLI